MNEPPTLLIATSNRGKLREVRGVLGDLAIRLRALDEFPAIEAPVEDEETFAANARIKAIYYARHRGGWALADDSGLEVDALDGAPGVYSARFAGLPCDDRANNAKLIAALRDVPALRRTARFRCAIAVADGRGVLAEASGLIEGVIVDTARGDNGFGYDPHFFVPELGKTTAELEPAMKNRISHRGRALAAIRPELERILLLPPN